MDEVKIILTGACGRMGHAVLTAVSKEPKATVIAGVDVAPDTSFVPL